MSIAVCRFYFKYAVTQFKNGNIECTATQIVNGNRLVLFLILIKTECQRSSSRFVDNALYVKTGDFSGIFCCLALRIIKISRNSNYSFRNRLAKIIFRCFLHFLKDECRNFLRTELLFFSVLLNLNTAVCTIVENCIRKLCSFSLQFAESVADKTFYRIHSILRICYHLIFGRLTDNAISLCSKSYDRRSRSAAFRILNDNRLAILHNSNT